MIFKFLGILMLIGASSYIGIALSQRLGFKVKRLELIKHMLEDISTLIRYRALTVREMINELSKNEYYQKLNFLREVAENQKESEPFYITWNYYVDNDLSLTTEEKEELKTLGNNLGSSDIEGQLAIVELHKQKNSQFLKSAEEDYKQKGKMYRSLGLLTGVFIAVMMI